jgi:hypothetical protein
MTLRAQRIFTVTCDACGAEHHDPTAESGLEMRVAAGVAGWKFRQGKPGKGGKGQVRQFDACPDCEVPS